jgi:hypothetical protein
MKRMMNPHLKGKPEVAAVGIGGSSDLLVSAAQDGDTLAAVGHKAGCFEECLLHVVIHAHERLLRFSHLQQHLGQTLACIVGIFTALQGSLKEFHTRARGHDSTSLPFATVKAAEDGAYTMVDNFGSADSHLSPKKDIPCSNNFVS